MEQVLIKEYKLARYGGQLINKINSIASANPLYGAALECGTALVEAAGYVF